MNLILALLLAAAPAGPVCPQTREAPPICMLDWMFGTWSVTNEDPTGGLFGGPADGGVRAIRPIPGGVWLEFRQAGEGQETKLLFLGSVYEGLGWVSVTLDENGQVARATAANDAWVNGRAVFEGQVSYGPTPVAGRLVFERRGADEFVLTTEMRAEGRWQAIGIERFRRRAIR